MYDGTLTTEQRNTLLKRESSSDVYLPFRGPVKKKWARLTHHGSIVATLALSGWGWEALDDASINGLDTRLHQLSNSIAGERMVITTHVVRSLADASEYPDGQFRSEFSRGLDAAYGAHLVDGRLYRNDLFLSVEIRPAAVTKTSIMEILGFKSVPPEETIDDLVARMDDCLQAIERQLHDCSPRRLGLRFESRCAFDEIAEAFYLILYGERRRIPLVSGEMGGSLHQERIRFTWERIDIFGDGAVRHAAIYGLKGYPSGGRRDDEDEFPGGTMPGQLSRLLSAPYSFTLTQSFGYLIRDKSLAMMKHTKNQMHNARDAAVGQANALGLAAEAVAGNEIHMGSHHLSLMVLAPTKRALLDVAAQARSDLSECGVVAVRENLGIEGAFWAQLPANDKWRARPAVISSECFWHMSPMHNYPVGRSTGYWGAPVALVRATGGTPFRLHFHDGDLGNAYIIGPAGTGKTTTLAFLLSQSEKTGAQSIVFDKDEGLLLTVRAMGGSYSKLRAGEPTGISILKALDNTPSNRTHLISLIRAMIMWGDDSYRIKQDEEERLSVALEGMMDMDSEDRSLSELRPALGISDPEGAGARLQKWCWGDDPNEPDGELGWALDCPKDTVSFDANVVGFDLTTILDHPAARGPIMAHLFHRSEALLDGRRVITWWDEFWRALLDPNCADMIQNALKTRRKLNSPVILATQSARDVLKSDISRSIIEQCPTAYYMPNPRADHEDYVTGLKLSEPEFRIVHEDLVGRRAFLFKQGETSLSCDLDLGDLPGYVAVLSGRRSTVRLAERIMDKHGDSWLQEFMRRWREAEA